MTYCPVHVALTFGQMVHGFRTLPWLMGCSNGPDDLRYVSSQAPRFATSFRHPPSIPVVDLVAMAAHAPHAPIYSPIVADH
jgi:hypothetical protein